MPRKLAIPEHAHWTVKRLYEEMVARKITLEEASLDAGLSSGMIWRWGQSTNPQIHNIEAALNAVGLELRIVMRWEQ